MGHALVLEGVGTLEEMETHVILALKQRDSLTDEVAARVVYEMEPPGEGLGSYRVRIPTPN